MVDISKQKVELILLYGSETGNCEQISEDLQDQLNSGEHKALFSSGAVVKRTVQRFSLNEYKKSKVIDKTCLKILVFICSSTGDGESPENGLEFFRYLRRETAKLDEENGTALSHVFYTVLGLGSSDYSKYQGAPR